jgi:hypothetical protein
VNGRLRTGCLSGLPQHATTHLVVEVIDAHRRAKLDDLIAASLDSDFIWRPARRAASRLGFNSDALAAGAAMAGAIEPKLVAVPERSALVIARWNRHIEAALAGEGAAAGGRGAQGSDSVRDSAISRAVLGWHARVRGRRAHLARAGRIFVLPPPRRRVLSLTVWKIT